MFCGDKTATKVGFEYGLVVTFTHDLKIYQFIFVPECSYLINFVKFPIPRWSIRYCVQKLDAHVDARTVLKHNASNIVLTRRENATIQYNITTTVTATCASTV